MLLQLKKNGFSLLEVMVVVFLMALFSTVAIMRLGVGQGATIESEARQFAERLNVLMDESLLSGQAYRVVFSPEDQSYEYQFFDSEWRPMTDKPFTKKTLKNSLAFDLQTTASVVVENNEDQLSESNLSDNNIVTIDTDGVTTVFELRFGERQKTNKVNIEAYTWLVKGGQTVDVSNEDGS